MSSWRLARSLEILRSEINARWPNRSKASDGTIGDAAHQSQGSASDHNPWIKDASGEGVVRAFDATSATIDAVWLAEHLRELGAQGDPRLQNHGYIIFDGRIASEVGGWAWRSFAGDPHTNHIHVSVARDTHYDSGEGWGVFPAPGPAPAPIPEEMTMGMPRCIEDPKAAADAAGRVAHWEVHADGNVFCWDGARQLASLDAYGQHPPIQDVQLDESGDGLVLFGADGHQEPSGEWAKSTYRVLFGWKAPQKVQ